MITGMDILKSGIARRTPFEQRLHRLRQSGRLFIVRPGIDARQSLRNQLEQLRNQNRIDAAEVNGWSDTPFGQEIINFLNEDHANVLITPLVAIVLKEPTDPDQMRIKEMILVRGELEPVPQNNQQNLQLRFRSFIPQKRIRYIQGHMRLQKAVGGGSSWLDIKKYD